MIQSMHTCSKEKGARIISSLMIGYYNRNFLRPVSGADLLMKHALEMRGYSGQRTLNIYPANCYFKVSEA